MLPRVLEPEVMDSAAEAVDYDQMDHSHVNQLFVAAQGELLVLLHDDDLLLPNALEAIIKPLQQNPD